MKKLLLLLLLFPFLRVEAQDYSRFRVGVEYGSYEMEGEIDDRWEFRRAKSRFSSQENHSGREHVIGEGEVHYAGLKSEFSAWKNRLTFASGIRYTRVNERISSAGGSPLYLFHPSSQGVELFRVRAMNESLGYLGIPLETDIVLLGRLSNWQLYLKAGIQAGVKIHGNTDLDFVSKEMEQYKDEILATAGKAPSDFFVNAYSSLGLRLILNSGVRLSIEGLFPPNYLTKDNFSLLAPESFGGVQLSVSLPVNFFSTK
jgi:hypothetical protein